jgi:hypothetical protein
LACAYIGLGAICQGSSSLLIFLSLLLDLGKGGFTFVTFFSNQSFFQHVSSFFIPILSRKIKMKNLILALNKANLSDSDMESVLTDFENWIDSKVVRSEQKMITESIAPIQKENDGIRSEVRLLAETMKHGFEMMDQKLEERFQRIDQKLEFTRKNLELQIASNRETSELQTSRLEKQIASTRENLETQIKANDKQLSLVQKLLWLVLTLVLGLFAKAVHLF